MLRFRTGVVCLALLLAALPGVVLAQSQATTGVIEGTVSDAGGAPLPGASVAIRNTATNFEKTDDHGAGRPLPGPRPAARPLPGDRDACRASRRSCARASTSRVGQTINLALALSVSQKTESITVTAAAPVVETTRTEGAVADRQRRRSRASRTTAATSSTSRS